MKETVLTCIECPMGCTITVSVDNGIAVNISGNGCPRGKLYAENEVICPMRVLTTTVKTTFGVMLPVKTDKPIKKAEIFSVMRKINGVTVDKKVDIGDIIVANISDGANLVAADKIL